MAALPYLFAVLELELPQARAILSDDPQRVIRDTEGLAIALEHKFVHALEPCQQLGKLRSELLCRLERQA